MLLAPTLAALVVSISSTADVSPTLVQRVVREATTIWQPAGVSLVWQREVSDGAASIDVMIGPERGTTPGPNTPLGWIEFNSGRPQRRLYLSYTNAMALLESVDGGSARMPLLKRDTYIGRALGRALAHEIGHYLLATTAHAGAGLMKANFTAVEFFSAEAPHFTISSDERAVAVARLEAAPVVASATSGSTSPRSPHPASLPRGAARWPGTMQD